jgi:tripartite-type tricarboxylate transporter receptor subunit TctC
MNSTETRDDMSRSARRRLGLVGVLGLALGALILGLSSPVLAQNAWSPNKPIRMVIPYPPGGATDVAARALVMKLGDALGQPMVPDNKAGANGMIASELVFNAPADGYTVLMATADTNSINPNVFSKMSYVARDFRGVAPVAKVNFMLVARPGLKANTLSELVALAKGSELTYASWGVGSTSQVAMEMFKAKADVKILHVPYQGAAPAFQAIMAGQVDVMMAPASIVIPALSKVKAFGIASPQRFAGTTVPTLTEQGYAVDADAWVGLLAPPKTPQAAIDHIYKQVNAVTADPEMKKRLQDIGLSSFSPAMTQEQFHNYMVAEIDRWGQVIRNAGIRLDN